jgi:purine catabolism regulator
LIRTDDSCFLLGDLLDSDELGLRLVTGSPQAGRRPVRGAYRADLRHPAIELDRDWLLLTTGPQLGESADLDAAFLAEIAEAGVAGLGLALGPVHEEVPAGVVRAAQELGFPVFAVPPETPLREVTGAVFRAVANSDVRASRRLVSIQRSLIGALSDDLPRERLLRKLASHCGAQVAVIGALGQVGFQTNPLPPEAVRHCLKSGPEAILYLDFPGHHGFALPVTENGAAACDWLVLTWPVPRAAAPELAEAAARLAVPLLGAISRLSHAERVVQRQVRRAALEALLDTCGGETARMLTARCLAYGLDLSGGVRVVAVARGAEFPAGQWLEERESALEATRTPFLAAEIGGILAVLLPATVPDGFIAENLLMHGRTLRAGVGRAVSDGPGVASSWADARLAVEAQAGLTPRRITRYDDLDLGTVLLNEISADRLGPKIDQLLGPLSDSPDIRKTLVAYLRHDQDVVRTARDLALHPNSVRYRLARAEQLLGVSIRASSTIVALHLALVHGGFAADADEALPSVARLGA